MRCSITQNTMFKPCFGWELICPEWKTYIFSVAEKNRKKHLIKKLTLSTRCTTSTCCACISMELITDVKKINSKALFFYSCPNSLFDHHIVIDFCFVSIRLLLNRFVFWLHWLIAALAVFLLINMWVESWL